MESKDTAAVRLRLDGLRSEREASISMGADETDREIINLDSQIRIAERDLYDSERRDRDTERRRTETEALSPDDLSAAIRKTTQRGHIRRVYGESGVAADGVSHHMTRRGR